MFDDLKNVINRVKRVYRKLNILNYVLLACCISMASLDLIFAIIGTIFVFIESTDSYENADKRVEKAMMLLILIISTLLILLFLFKAFVNYEIKKLSKIMTVIAIIDTVKRKIKVVLDEDLAALQTKIASMCF